MRRLVPFITIVLLAFLVLLAVYARQRSPQPLDQPIVSLLQCEECVAGELDSVVALGTSAVPTLAGLLIAGPSGESRQLMEGYLRERYRDYVAYVTADSLLPLSMTEQEYVAEYAGNHVARVRRRCALALSAIGGPEATHALCEALRMDLRRDVRATILQALGGSGAC